jgi:hypothetical protein
MSLLDCCARAASGHAAAAPPSSVMNSRLLPRNSIRKRFGINDLPVSSILVRSAHGNSFDHLVGEREQLIWKLEVEPFEGLMASSNFVGCEGPRRTVTTQYPSGTDPYRA